MVIQHNLPASFTNRQMGINNKLIAKNTEKLASGYRINRSADDAACLSISEKMRGQIRGLNRAYNNAEDGISLIKTADGHLDEVTKQLHRIKELSVMAANDTYINDDRCQIQKEIGHLITEIDRIAGQAEFNTIKLFRPTRGVTSNSAGSIKWRNMDIVFCVDATGSMGGIINNVKDNVDGFVNTLESRGISTKLGLVVYRDCNIGEDLETYSYFNSTKDFKDKLNSINVSGGGDEPESGLEAIMDGAIKMEGRKDADKHYILVTDASVHTSDITGKSKYTIDEVAGKLKSEKVGLTIIGSNSYIGSGGQTKDLLNKSGGGLFLDINKNFSSGLLKLAEGISSGGEGNFDIIYQYNWLQIGSNTNQGTYYPIHNISSKVLGIENLSVETQDNAEKAISSADFAIGLVTDIRANYGAVQNRLEHAIDNISNASLNLSSAESRIMDADMADEMVQFSSMNIIQQAAQSVLAQANSSPEGILALIS